MEFVVDKWITRYLIIGGALNWLELSILKTRLHSKKWILVTFFQILIDILLFCTVVFGSFVVYNIYLPNFNDSSDPNYCHYIVYWVSFVLTSSVFIYVLFAIFISFGLVF